MKSLEEVCKEFLFLSEEEAQTLLIEHFPGYTVKINKDGMAYVYDVEGNKVATVFTELANFQDMK